MVRVTVHVRDNENFSVDSLLPFFRATASEIVWIAAIFPMPLIAAASAICGDTMLSSLPSSHRPVELMEDKPSETVTQQFANSFLSAGCKGATTPGSLTFLLC